MNDDTIGQILAFLGFVWFLVLLSLQSVVRIQSTRHVCMRVVTMRHDPIVVIAFCMIVLQDVLICQTVLTRHQAKLLRIVRTRAHLPEAHPHLLRRRRIPHRRVRLIIKMPAVLILMDTMTLTCNRTMTKTDTRKTAIMPKVSMMRWMMLITNMEKSIK